MAWLHFSAGEGDAAVGRVTPSHAMPTLPEEERRKKKKKKKKENTACTFKKERGSPPSNMQSGTEREEA